MILKAGTYRFKEPLILSDNDVGIYQNINFTLAVDYEGYTAIATCDRFSIGGSADNFIKIEVNILSLVPDLLAPSGVTYPVNMPIYTYNSDSTYSWGFGNSPMTITTDTEVSDTFGTWYIANTNYNEVNAKPLATIEYNGQTFSLDAGDKATIPCAELKMRTDVVVKVNEVESKKEVALLEKTIIANGTYKANEESLVINWDGDITGRQKFVDVDENIYYKVSDLVLSLEELQNSTQRTIDLDNLVWEETECSADAFSEFFPDTVTTAIQFSYGFCIQGYVDGVYYSGIYAYNDETTYLSQIILPNVNGGYSGYSELNITVPPPNGMTIGWDGDTTGRVSTVQHYKVSNKVLTLDELAEFTITKRDTHNGLTTMTQEDITPYSEIENVIFIGYNFPMYIVSGEAGTYTYGSHTYTLAERGTYFAMLGDVYVESINCK